jgi:hypothetical protein
MTSLRTNLAIYSISLAALLFGASALARPGGGFSGSHGGGFSGGRSQMSSGGHGGWRGGGGYRGGYGRGYYGGFYGGLYFDPWVYGAAWGYDMSYPAVVGYSAYPYDAGSPAGGAYVQQAAPPPSDVQQLNQSSDWYYCSNPAGYYPYVKSCAVGWQRVPSTPPK